jgi:hypothetical protein
MEQENYEGWRVRVAEGDGKEGWILLRPSLHDPGVHQWWRVQAWWGTGPPMWISRLCLCSHMRPTHPPASPVSDVVLNVESEVQGGMRAILQHLLEFFKAHPGQGAGRAACCASAAAAVRAAVRG